MPPRVGWSSLKIGIIAFAAIIATAACILIFGRVGVIRGSKFTLYVTSDAARGVIRGTEVWLDGRRVGTVEQVDFRAPAVAASERVVLELRILSSAHERIRRDSKVDIRPGTSILAEQVVSLRSGTTRQPELADGDTLHAPKQSDVQKMSAEFGVAAKEFPAILNNVKLLSAQLQSTASTIGALSGDAGSREMMRIRRQAARLAGQLRESDGTVRRVMSQSGALRERAGRALAQVDSVKALLASEQHSLGRFRKDSTIVTEVRQLRTELSRLALLARDSSTVIGRVRGDSAIIRSIRRDLRAMDSLMADMKRRPLRYIVF
jgi:phospholipid/cholesterol/gamma-HCH transport system substrate-binding protein